MWSKAIDPVEPFPRFLQRLERGAFELVELTRLRIVRIFRPTHPEFSDVDILEFLFRPQEPRIVIPVLMGQNDYIQSCREGSNILDDFLDLIGSTAD
jgi:hypothetical protein